MGTEPDKLIRDYWELDDSTKLMGILRGCVCGWWYRQTAT